MRLIDANALKEKMKCTNRYFSIKFDIDEAPTIDPETLPIVQELREQLAKVTAERNAVIEQLHGKCSACKHYSQYHAKEKCKTCKWDNASLRRPVECWDDCWEWRGLQEV